jgi:hypothetical protein
MEHLLFFQILTTSFLTGLIWVIQCLHYPSFPFVAEKNFSQFLEFHQKRITILVAPMMLLELALALILFFTNNAVWNWVNVGSTLMIWLSTFLLSVPEHNRLAIQRDEGATQRLVATNWYRTFLWSFRLIFLSVIFCRQ